MAPLGICFRAAIKHASIGMFIFTAKMILSVKIKKNTRMCRAACFLVSK